MANAEETHIFKYDLHIDKITSVPKITNAMNAINGSAMISGNGYKVSGKSLLGLMSLLENTLTRKDKAIAAPLPLELEIRTTMPEEKLLEIKSFMKLIDGGVLTRKENAHA